MTTLLKILYVIGMIALIPFVLIVLQHTLQTALVLFCGIALWVATSKMAYLEYKEEWG